MNPWPFDGRTHNSTLKQQLRQKERLLANFCTSMFASRVALHRSVQKRRSIFRGRNMLELLRQFKDSRSP